MTHVPGEAGTALPRVGERFGGYRIEALVGRGGMGLVYRAEQLRLGRSVALKVIAPDLAEDPEFRERFERECRMAASIEHPNMVPLYEAGELHGVLFVTMRYVDGVDLASVLRHEGKLEPARASRTVAAVASALDAAHAHGLVHRDVKPANILLARSDEEEQVYLTDFGVAKQLDASTTLTATGHVLGTLDYIAPEQIEGAPASRASDVYALGCTLYHALTGRVPYPGPSQREKIAAHLCAPPPVPSAAAATPAGLDAVVERAMAKRREDRYETAGELGRAALGAAEGRGSEAAQAAVASRSQRSPTSTDPAAVAPDEAARGTRSAPLAAPGPAPASPPAVPPARRWSGRLVVVAVALVVAVAALLAVLLRPGGSGGGSGEGSRGEATESTAYSAPTFTASYPRGWRVSRDYARVGSVRRSAFASADGRAGVSIDRTPGVAGRPQELARRVNSNLARTVSGYRLTRSRPDALAGRATRELLYSTDGSNAPRNGAAYVFLAGGALYVVTSTGAEAAAVRSVGRSTAGSLRAR